MGVGDESGSLVLALRLWQVSTNPGLGVGLECSKHGVLASLANTFGRQTSTTAGHEVLASTALLAGMGLLVACVCVCARVCVCVHGRAAAHVCTLLMPTSLSDTQAMHTDGHMHT